MEPCPHLHSPCQKGTAQRENQVNERWEKDIKDQLSPRDISEKHPRRLSDCNSHTSGTIMQQIIIQWFPDNFKAFFRGLDHFKV